MLLYSEGAMSPLGLDERGSGLLPTDVPRSEASCVSILGPRWEQNY